MRFAGLTVLLFLVWFSLPCLGQGQKIQAFKAEEAPKIDGVLDDICWQRLPDTDDFRYEEGGAPVPEKTQAWICYDSRCIYVAFRCMDSQPDKIAAQQKKRGGAIWSDDYVGCYIDPWHAHGPTYHFNVTPRGTQQQEFPGDGGSKIEWQGDWTAAARTDETGWTAEMAIPWPILKYPKNQDTIGLYFFRRHARTDGSWCSPYLGPHEDISLMYDWVGLEPPSPKLNSIALHYTNVGLGGVRFQNGLDIKKQLSQQVNGLITINPDFGSVEQNVENIDFTYSPRVLSDKRPFFAEGGTPHHESEYRMFYSRDIEEVDFGTKVTGHTGSHEFAGLMTTSGRGDRHIFYKSRWTIGQDNRIGLAAVSTREPGIENNVLSAYGRLGKRTASRFDYCEYQLMKSFTPGAGGDGTITLVGAGGEGGPRQFGWGLWYQDVQPDYYAADGIVPEPDLKGWNYHIDYWDEYADGWIRGWSIELYGVGQRLHSNDLLSRGLSLDAGIWTLNNYYHLGFWRGAYRDESTAGDGSFITYRDRTYSLGYGWNQNDMYERGWIDLTFGKVAGGRSLHCQMKQAFKLGDPFHIDLNVEFVKMTGPYARRDRQVVASLSYDLSSERSVSARLIERDGTLNLSLGFRQAVSRGEDIYILFGDPNADKTVNRVVVKLIRPLF